MIEAKSGTSGQGTRRRGATQALSRPVVLTPERLREKIYDTIADAFPYREIDPFWMRLFDGSLPIDGVRHWAKQLYFITRDLGRYRSAIHANCPVFEVRHALVRALYEEHGELREAKDRPALFRKFAAAIGITERDLAMARALPETEALTDWLLDLGLHGHFTESLAGFAVVVDAHLNRNIPVLTHVFRNQHGLDEAAMEFWTVRSEDELEQGRRALDVVLRYADTATLQANVLDTVHKSAERLALFNRAIARWYRNAQTEERLAVNA